MIYEGDDWAALYQDGVLIRDTVGDRYHAVDRALDLCGVEVIQDEAFMRGQNGREGVAQTIAEVEAYKAERDAKAAQAAILRADAATLIARAKELDGGPDDS